MLKKFWFIRRYVYCSFFRYSLEEAKEHGSVPSLSPDLLNRKELAGLQ